jgi:hypothetical protein
MSAAQFSLGFDPLVGWGLLALLAALVLGLALWSVRRRAGWLRLGVGCCLLLALLNPRLISDQRRPLPDTALVVVDRTASQSLGDRAAQTDGALAALLAGLKALPDLDVRVESVGDDPSPKGGTRLFAGIERALGDIPREALAGVVMITDGLVHDVPADQARSLGVPVHALLTGAKDERDRRLVAGEMAGFALVGKDAPIRFRVEEAGASGAVNVTVRLDGEAFATLSVPVNRPARLELPIRHAGANLVELEVEPGAHELTLDNNRLAVSINGVRERLKVLLISGEPHPGERVWRNLLKADPSVDLVHFTILRPPEKDDGTPINEMSLITFPVRELFEEKLYDFDLVILDRYRRRGVLSSAYYRNLADYVRKGGALLAAVGPEFNEPGSIADTSLAGVLPAQPGTSLAEGEFRPLITELGLRHPVTAGLAQAQAAGWGGWLRRVGVTEVKGQSVLAAPDGQPLLLLGRAGEGRIALLLSDTVWLWARGWQGGGPHAELLRRLSHWLMKEPELEEEALTAAIDGDSLEITRQSLEPGAARVAVTAPDGSHVDLDLADRGDGRAGGRMPALLPGLWRAEDGKGHVAVAAKGARTSLEMTELAATPRHLAPVAKATGGGLSWLAEGGVPRPTQVEAGAKATGPGWLGLVRRHRYQSDGVRDLPLLPVLIPLILAMIGLLATWRREGRG